MGGLFLLGVGYKCYKCYKCNKYFSYNTYLTYNTYFKLSTTPENGVNKWSKRC